MFAGSMVALVTPFKDGKIDWPSLEALVEFHIKNGTNGIVPCGTTGESATLDHKEHHEVVAGRDQDRQQASPGNRRDRDRIPLRKRLS